MAAQKPPLQSATIAISHKEQGIEECCIKTNMSILNQFLTQVTQYAIHIITPHQIKSELRGVYTVTSKHFQGEAGVKHCPS